MPILRLGSTGDIVKIWQAILGVTTTGEFDVVTDKATRIFQKRNGLEQTGEVG